MNPDTMMQIVQPMRFKTLPLHRQPTSRPPGTPKARNVQCTPPSEVAVQFSVGSGARGHYAEGMLSEPDGMTTLAKLLFLVPAVFAMLAAPFWIWAQLRSPAPSDEGDDESVESEDRDDAFTDDEASESSDDEASGSSDDGESESLHDGDSESLHDGESESSDDEESESSDDEDRDPAPPDDDQRSC